ncbi:unnamed protein product [Durusdinium trenchii]|uniref:Uncharacterized protein n=1 Tax=Durusdinium trenchii TaxID=1381693 RepID=A0ABP0HP55_9DINO
MCDLRYEFLLCNACSLRYVLLLRNATKTWSWDVYIKSIKKVKIARKTHGLPGVVVQLEGTEGGPSPWQVSDFSLLCRAVWTSRTPQVAGVSAWLADALPQVAEAVPGGSGNMGHYEKT